MLQSVKANMSLKHLQDSEDVEFMSKLEEADELLSEGVASALGKFSLVASLMAVPGLLPADALAKSLSKASAGAKSMTVDSPEAKRAIEDAATSSKVLGQMSEANVVNAIAQVLWREARGKTEGTAGRKAVASVILNRSGNDPTCIVDVLREKGAFSCLSNYSGGWTDSTYKWYLPYKELQGNAANKAIWDECNAIALQLVDKKFKSTIGNRNSYLNKSTASKSAVNSWGKKCDLKVGSHSFGYLAEHDPKIVKPGTMIAWKKINAKKPNVVVVKSGDTLGKIAKANNTTVAELAKKNSLKDPDKISVGQTLKI